MKKACPVLQCPLSKQIKLPGECCPKCSEKRMITQFAGKCILGKGFHADGMRFNADQCSSCTCMNGTSICQRNTCPVLECAPLFQRQESGECCPSCPPMAEVRSTCTYEGKTFKVRIANKEIVYCLYSHCSNYIFDQSNDTWNLDTCRSCRCHSGEIRCAQTKCPLTKCRPNETLVKPKDQCCSKCIESKYIPVVYFRTLFLIFL